MPILFSLLLRLCTIQLIAVLQIPATESVDPDVASRPHVVVVRPIVVCDDDGENAAAIRLPKKRVDRVFTKADLEVLYLSPQRWSNGAGRRGEVDLDMIVRHGIADGRISQDPRVVNLLFVSAIDGKTELQGRGLQNANICFICLGPNPGENDPATEAFVIAHELGHCFNLVHAIDDSNVPDDVPNIQGEGPMESRLAVEGLHDSQRDTVLKSALVNDRIHFCSREEAEKRLVDESWEPYVSSATDDMLRYSLGLPANAPIPGDPASRLEFARQGFAEFASEFTEDEKEFLTSNVELLEEMVGDDWPLFCRIPWDFVKVEPGFYNNAMHTRGMTIFVQPSGISYMRQRTLYAMWVLAHEKMHIVQRVSRDVFHSYYEAMGYERFELDQESVDRLRLKQNPDAFTHRWAFPIEGKLHFLATVFEITDEQTYEKTHRLIPLEKREDGTYNGLPEIDIALMDDWKSRFAILESGYEDPNELSAYFVIYLISRYLDEWEPTRANPEMLEKARVFFDQILSVAPSDDR